MLEVAVGEGEDAMGQIAPGGQQLVIIATPEIIPGEVGVPSLRGVDRQVITERVGIVPAQVVGEPHGPVSTC